MNKFAKIFETDIGQIVAMRQDENGEIQIVYYFLSYIENLGLCRLHVSFFTKEDADKKFNMLTSESVHSFLIKETSDIFNSQL